MVIASANHPPRLPWAGPCHLVILGGLTSPQGWLLCVRLVVVSSREGTHALMLEPSWRVDAMVVVLLLLDMVAALDEGLAHTIAVKVGFDDSAVRSARRGAWCAQGARFLESTCL